MEINSQQIKEKKSGAAIHFATLLWLIVPFGNLLGPWLAYRIKGKGPELVKDLRDTINFQLTILLAVIPFAFLQVLMIYSKESEGSEIFLASLVIMTIIKLGGLVLSCVKGVKTASGKDFRYPLSLSLVSMGISDAAPSSSANTVGQPA